MSEIKLLPCPFCGGEARLTKKNRIIVDGKTERECHVHCTKCNARAERILYKSCSTTEIAHELAKKLWNTRKPMERIVERIKENSKHQWESDSDYIYTNKAIEIVKEEGGIDA